MKPNPDGPLTTSTVSRLGLCVGAPSRGGLDVVCTGRRNGSGVVPHDRVSIYTTSSLALTDCSSVVGVVSHG